MYTSERSFSAAPAKAVRMAAMTSSRGASIRVSTEKVSPSKEAVFSRLRRLSTEWMEPGRGSSTVEA